MEAAAEALLSSGSALSDAVIAQQTGLSLEEVAATWRFIAGLKKGGALAHRPPPRLRSAAADAEKAAPSAAKPAVVVASSPASVAAAATTKPAEKDIRGSETTAAPAAASGFEARWTKCIDPIISRLMEGQVRFASVFVDVVGKAAMTFGPESEEVRAAVEKADAAIGQLLDRLKAKDLWPDKLNLIVTGTPGYATLTPNHLIDLSAMVDPKFYMTVGESPVLNIRPLGMCLLLLYNAI